MSIEAGWISRLAMAIRSAPEGVTISVSSEAEAELGRRAAVRMGRQDLRFSCYLPVPCPYCLEYQRGADGSCVCDKPECRCKAQEALEICAAYAAKV